MTARSKTNQVKLKCCVDTKADKVHANKCPNNNNNNMQIISNVP